MRLGARKFIAIGTFCWTVQAVVAAQTAGSRAFDAEIETALRTAKTAVSACCRPVGESTPVTRCHAM